MSDEKPADPLPQRWSLPRGGGLPLLPVSASAERVVSPRLLPWFLPLLLAGCAALGPDPSLFEVEEPLRGPRTQAGATGLGEPPPAGPAETGFFPTPRAIVRSGVLGSDESSIDPLLADAPAEPVTINIDGMSVPAFVNEIYGNLLRVPFQIDPGLERLKDLVTLRVPEPRPVRDIHGLVVDVLEAYGVAVVVAGDYLRIAPARSAPVGEPPLLISGRTLPSVPVGHRPVFQVIQPSTVSSTQLNTWLREMFKGQDLEIREDSARNTLMLSGQGQVVARVVEAVQGLDQPLMRGRVSLRVEPRFWGAEDLANRLVAVLETEGYAATVGNSRGSIVFVPIPNNNALIVFASDDQVMDHVRDWIVELDRPGQEREGEGLFYYYVKNTDASNIVGVLESTGMVGFAAPAPGTAPGPGAALGAPGGALQQAVGRGRRQLIADETRNGILFAGDAATWYAMLPVIEQMDQPDKLVLIEVTIAEISLTDDLRSGVEWLFRSGVGDLDGVGGTLGGLGVLGTASGFTYTLNNAGEVRAVLNLFERSDRARILSTPRIMVKSGAEASIDVGRQVPVITSRAQGDVTEGGNSAVLQQITLINTGVILDVRPVIYSGNRISLEVTQTVSEAQPNTTSGVDTPEIKDNTITTELILKDGGSVLLGGLISSQTTNNTQKVPLLGDIPGLGRLFRSESTFSTRQEILMLVVPYVVEDHDDAADITRAYRERLKLVE